MIPSSITRVLVALALLATLVAGGLWYRSSLLETGRQTGLAQADAAIQAANTKATQAAAQATQASADRHSVVLKTLKDQHAKTVRDLSLALADSDHRNQRLSGRIASLLDEAAGLRAGIASASDPSVPTPDPVEADSTVEALIQTTADNYAICRTNAATLAELQMWYLNLRDQRSPINIE